MFVLILHTSGSEPFYSDYNIRKTVYQQCFYGPQYSPTPSTTSISLTFFRVKPIVITSDFIISRVGGVYKEYTSCWYTKFEIVPPRPSSTFREVSLLTNTLLVRRKIQITRSFVPPRQINVKKRYSTYVQKETSIEVHTWSFSHKPWTVLLKPQGSDTVQMVQLPQDPQENSLGRPERTLIGLQNRKCTVNDGVGCITKISTVSQDTFIGYFLT